MVRPLKKIKKFLCAFPKVGVGVNQLRYDDVLIFFPNASIPYRVDDRVEGGVDVSWR